MKTDIIPVSVDVYFIPVETRVPLKFGTQVVTHVTCVRVCVTVANKQGQKAQGWGETPLSAEWAWPSSSLGHNERNEVMEDFCRMLGQAWVEFNRQGHPMELGHDFIESILPGLLGQLNDKWTEKVGPMPHLAALVCSSAFDVAIHDAYGKLLERDVYSTYNAAFMNTDLSHFIEPAQDSDVSFAGKYPEEFFAASPAKALPAWHLVGGKDLLDTSELTGKEPDDGYPVLLPEWIKRDGLTCLKVKLRGNDSAWDYERLIKVGIIAQENNVVWLTSDFNCTVTDPVYVNDILDRLV
ncbi:MAG: hypothetical protein RQ760_19625, partial [Sedimentisphaerales bacterium]|nr:hypothetical protein [Sedimentisphaerales bacterium]